MRRLMLLVPVLTLCTTAFAPASLAKWPAWLSIESPVNPFDRANSGALVLVHAMTRDGPAKLTDLNGTAQGIVNGSRRSAAIHFDTTSKPGVYAVRKQWPSEGTWLLQIVLFETTAIVVLDHQGNVASVRVPTELQKGNQIPRAVAGKEIDSTLTAAARR